MDKVKHIKKYSFFNLPKFGRTTLEPVKLFSELIGNPYKNYKSIHIAGTNGKGTVSYKLARIMQHAGFRTGLFISPHLVKFNERISIDGEDISDDDLFRIENELYRIYEEQDSKPDLVIFDMITMIAFKYFEEKKVDYAIVEVGMGGTLDPTNIITPEISIITSIGYDHMQILGDTLELISSQKLGICKPGVPAVIGPDCPQTFMRDYMEKDLKLNLDDVNFLQYAPKTKGNYQLENTEIVKKCCEILNKDEQILSDEAINEGINFDIPGRLQKMSENIYFDGGHNPAGIEKSINTLFAKFPSEKGKKLIILCGFSQITNVNANFNAIFNHEKSDQIQDIILVECNKSDIEFINFLPSCIKVQTLMKQIQDTSCSKVKVLCSENDENFELRSISNFKIDMNFSKGTETSVQYEYLQNWASTIDYVSEGVKTHSLAQRDYEFNERNSLINKFISKLKACYLLSRQKPVKTISGDVQQTLQFVRNQKTNKDCVILVLGSFRLYRSVNELFT